MLDFNVDVENIVDQGWKYIKNNFYDVRNGLFKRFSIKDKKGLVKFDLYDNAEALGIGLLLGENEFAKKLKKSIDSKFMSGQNFYSIIDVLRIKRNKNHLRWATIPYLLVLSEYYLIFDEED